MPTREDAWNLLCEWTQSEALRRHALGVEAAMRAMARRLGGDPGLWGLTGLVHDFDYERHPTAPDHPVKGAEVLRERGYPEEVVQAVLGHAAYTGVPRETPMARALFAVDELTGFLFACAYVQPNRKVAEVRPESVKKKLKDKAFARSVNREDIRTGAEEAGIPLEELVVLVRDALAERAEELGL
ncbi:MAG: HDIG domain-containing metalloprotein [Acidobacteriota bacterium]